MGHKLLLADDSITIQKVVGIIFSNDDYELTVVDNGNSALDTARSSVPDIMLIDAIMPGKNGYDVCREARRDPLLSQVPILLLTGVFEPFDEDKAKESGADDFISKPFESQHLVDKVKALVEEGKKRSAGAPAVAVAAVAAAPAFVAPAPSAPPFLEDVFAEPEPAPASPDIFAPAEPAPFEADVFAVEESEAFAAEAVEAEVFAIEAEPAVFAPEAPAEEVFAAGEIADEWSAEEVMEATAEDDPWGTLELGEEEIAYGEVVEEAIPAAEEGILLEEEPFSFAGEPAVEVVEAAPVAAIDVPGLEESAEPFSFGEEPPVETAGESFFAPDGEEVFSFAEEESVDAPAEEELFVFEEEPAVSLAAPAEAIAVSEEPAFEVASPFEFVEETPVEIVPPAMAPVVEQQFVHEEEFVPAPAAAAPAVAPVVAPVAAAVSGSAVAAAVAAAAPAATFTPAGEFVLTEEQLAAVVSKISRDLIERIAWEVVPDLAETIIREEIAKIKAGT